MENSAICHNPKKRKMNSPPIWGNSPALVIAEIFNYLKWDDLLNASSVCRNWRSNFFQKRFFRNFKFELNINNDRQCNFFLQTLINLTSELTLIFDARNVYQVDKVRRILYKIAKNDHLIGLRFRGTGTNIVTPGAQYSKGECCDIEQLFVEPIKMLLSRKVPPFKILDLGGMEPLALYSTDYLKALSRPQYLEEITLASIKYDPSLYPVLKVEPTLFEKCASLQVLSLDYDALSDDLLKTLEILPLKKLLICVHGLDEHHPGVSEEAWLSFSSKFQNIELILTLIYAYEAVEVLQHHILRRSMPITHIKVLFCNYINVAALDFIAHNYKDTLKSLWWIDTDYHDMDRNVMDLYFGREEDSLVMLSWICKGLEELVILGYVMDPHNLIGISRLRGRNLKKLEVSKLEPSPYAEMVNSCIEEVSTQLGRMWEPCDVNKLHPALGYIPVSDDIRDEYIMDLVRSDLLK